MKTKKNRTPLRTAFVYAIFGALWIVISDETLVIFVPPASPNHLVLQTIKGWLFVLTSAVLIYFIAKNDLKSLLESEKRYRAVAQTANDSIISADGEGNIVGWNHGAEQIFGYSESEVLGRPLTLILPARYHERHLAGMARMQAGGEKRVIGKTIELDGLRKDGSEFPLELSLSDWQVDDQKFYTSIIRDITERRRNEEKIKYQASLLANVQDAITASDEKFILTSWNRAAEEMFGWKAQEVLGKPGADVFRSEFIGIERSEVFRLVTETGVFRGEMSQYKKDGTTIFVEANTFAVRDETGRITAYVTVSRDITERKQVERALRSSEERYRVLSELISDYAYSFRIEPDGRTVYEWVTPGFTKIPGYTLEEIIERGGTISLVHPEDVEIARRHIRALLNNQTDTSEFRIVSKDGKVHWLRNYAQPILDETTQRICRIYGSTQVITEQKQAEEALRTSEENLRRAQVVAQI